MKDMRRAFLWSPAALCLLVGGRALAGDQERAAATQAAQTLYSAGQYKDALDAVNLAIEYTTDQFGDKSAELIDPFIQLGDIQRGLKHPERGVEAYQHAADLIEMNEGVFADRMVGVLRRMGAASAEQQKNDDAVASLQRAKVITHRNYGIMNLQQIPIIDALTTVYTNEGDRLSADREQMFGLRVNERRFGADKPEVIPALYHLAEWYRRTGQWAGARTLYKRAISIIESAYGPDDVRLVPALTGVADTYRGERTLRNDGRESLERATQVYAASEDADKADYGASLIDLGDWYLLTNHTDEALTAYMQAWQLLSSDGTAPEAAQKQLGRPTRLRYDERSLDQIDPPTSPAGAVGPKYVKVTFTVTDDGTVDDAVVVSSNASSRVVRQVRLMVMQARYRPGFVDGKPSPMQVTLLQRFYEEGAADVPVGGGEDAAAPGGEGGSTNEAASGATTSAAQPATPAPDAAAGAPEAATPAPEAAAAGSATPPAEPPPETP